MGRYIAAASALEVGQIIQAVSNPNSALYQPADGRRLPVASWPEYVGTIPSSRVPMGDPDSTVRTLTAAPSVLGIAASPSCILVNGVAATGGAGTLQKTANGGASFSGYDPTSSAGFTSLIYAGSRFVCASSTTAPYVTADGSPIGGGSFTATTGSTLTTTLTQGLAYGSLLNGGATGRVVQAKNGSLATAAGLAYMNDGATTWTAASGGSTITCGCILATASKVFAFSTASNLYKASSDGVTYADAYLPARIISINSGATDGVSTIVILCSLLLPGDTMYAYGMLASHDNGATWGLSVLPETGMFNPSGHLCYANGLFFFSQWYMQTLVSKDALTWVMYSPGVAGIPATTIAAIAYHSGIYLAVTTGTSAVSFVPNAAYFKAPMIVRAGTDNNGSHSLAESFPYFIKMK